jgi:tetratricopeptide (TPR) repeat protein
MARRSRIALFVLAAAVIVAVVSGLVIRRQPRFMSTTSASYEEVSRAFYHGYAALQVGLLDDAKTQFAKATGIVPSEPASWANLGLTELRLGEIDPAAQAIDRAAQLAPSNSDIAFLQGQLETGRGRPDEAIARFRRAVDLNPTGLRVRYALAQELESAGGSNADAQAAELLDQLVRLRPDNVAALLERARFAAKRSDGRVLQESIASLERQAGAWPAVAVEQYRALQQAASANDFPEAARTVAVLRNVLLRVPTFREDLLAIRTPAELIADPFDRFLSLPAAASKPSPADLAVTFSPEHVAGAAPANAVLSFSSNGTDRPALFAADAREVRRLTMPGTALPFPGGTSGRPPSANSMLAIDWNRDFRQDLVLAGPGGVRLFLQGSDGTFRDATADAAGTTEALNVECFGAWTADLEMDGDLDVIVGVNGAAPVALRNNGDGTWRRQQPFPGVTGLRAFAWGDLDRDGDPDAALLDAQGNLHLFENRQGGQFAAMNGPTDVGRAVALTLGDVNGDGVTDLILLDDKGTIRRASLDGEKWIVQTVAEWSGDWSGANPGEFRLLVGDLDNNGSLDLVASGTGRSRIWLSTDDGRFTALPATPSADVFSIVDLNDDGQLDLAGVADGQPAQWLGHGTKGYHWQVVRPRAQENAGDQRINSFGIGGEIEIRSGLLTGKQSIDATSVHFGLGTRTGIDVTRIVWPNGVVQADFERAANLAVVAEQRLKGSCPWVFADDGKGMTFVTDFLWRSPLGLRINAQDTAGVAQTEDWVKIRGDQLVARNGSYDVRITAELWETHFIDQVSLMAVDHPADLDVFVDERFAKESPALVVHQMTRPRAVVSARDDSGRDVTDLVAQQDSRYLATFERAGFQGIAKEHYVELELDRDISGEGRSWLVANGWVYPTDSSINVAIGQSGRIQPRGISLEAEDVHGRWIVASPDLGFPAGKNKTVLIDLGAIARAGVSHARRIRIRTNLEIYWDWLAIAEDRSATPMTAIRIAPEHADLRYRGFSRTDFARREVPELPRYSEIANTSARWRDLIGYYTRFGDVRELVQGADDRYVIMNAGDELRLSFRAPAKPPEGWVRDFVLIGDGWEKDGDFNTTFSKTVLPLPSHDRPDYGALSAPIDLESDPVYRRHPADWQTYHTRFVAPSPFLSGLH